MKNRHIFDAARNAVHGFGVLAGEKAARRELGVLIAPITLLMYEVNVYTLLVFVLSCLLLSLESMNTAIEMLCDLNTTEFDERIRAIKDVAASAIFIIPCVQVILLVIWYAHL